MADERCATCRFYEATPHRDGICRRYPPLPQYNGCTHPEMLFVWMRKDQWCGEHKLAELAHAS